MGLFDPSKKIQPNLKPYSERFLPEFYENGKQKLPSTINKMTEKISVKVHAKIPFGKKCKNQQKRFF